MGATISARTEKAQNGRCEEGFELAREKAELKRENGNIRSRSRLWLSLCIMLNEIELIEVIVNLFEEYLSY